MAVLLFASSPLRADDGNPPSLDEVHQLLRQRLRIAGNRPDSCREDQCNFLVMEITYGPFEAVLELPPGYDLTRAKAIYVNGFLRIDVPVEQTKATKIPIC